MVVFEKKKRIRHEIGELKRQLLETQKQIDADAVFRKIELLSEFSDAKTVMVYWSLPDELPTQRFVEKWKDLKIVLLPVVNGDNLILKQYKNCAELKIGLLGIGEPDSEKTYEGKVDLVIVPGVAFDRQKNRLGRGKGYYDRFLNKQSSYNIGVGFDFQLIDSVPVNPHDVKMEKVITPSHTIS